MPSWRKAARLVALCEQRKRRVEIEIARLARLARQSQALEAQLAAQIADLGALLDEQQGRTGMMDKAQLFEVRRHLAVLLSQKNDLRLEQQEALRQSEDLQRQGAQQRDQLLLQEKKRNKYQTWIAEQHRLETRHQAQVEQSDIEEQSVW